MKKSLFLLSLFCSSLLLAQKEKTLFWEISGNGLTKNSYLYGTMHVNDKVSYHLSDAFFKHLLNSDIVSNESDPETWDEIIGLIKQNSLESPYNFYRSFYMNPVKKETIGTSFENTNYFTNMLSGIEGAQADFQENTVLDMFIYQTGRKYKKRIVGLESAKESILSIMRINPDEAKPDDKNIEKLMKLMKNGNFNETLKNYYREKDIVMLDSIYKLMFSKKVHNVMITNRNVIMARSIDSLAQTGSLFSAIGAAHLAGKEGVIQLLRNKGYTVTPIIDVISEDGQKQKKAIEDFFPNPGFTISSTTDEMVKMPLNKKIIRNDENIGSPDFTNGGAINIKRIPLNSFLDKKNELYNPKSLDSLFFENIAGEIVEKNAIKDENYVGYDIKNTTKNGNNQHWRFYITPLELITVSMTGPGTYTKQFDKEIFDKIKIKSFKNSWEKVTPKKGGFSVDVPSFNLVYGNDQDEVKNTDIQAYDANEKAYYFLSERTLNSTQELEDTEFELKQMHYEFYLQHEIDSTKTNYDKVRKSFTSESKLGVKTIKLKSVIHGEKYYLLGTVNSSDANTNKFFDSFREEKFNYQAEAKTYNDTVAKLQIDIPKKQNENLFLDLNKERRAWKNKNAFISKSVEHTFYSESGKSVDLEYYKYHRYEFVQNLDSIKNDFRKTFLKESLFIENPYEDDYVDEYDDFTTSISLLNYDFNSRKGFTKSQWNKIMDDKEDRYEIISESTSYDKEKNIHVFEALVSRPKATQAIKYKVFFNEDSNTQLTALVDRNYKNDDSFIEKTFNSVVFKEKNTTSVFDDKLKVFMEDVMSEKDTIRYSAMNSVFQLKINKEDFDTVTNFIDTFQFKDSELNTLEILIKKIGEIEDPRVIPYLDGLYKKDDAKTAVQISVLQALTHQKSKLAYKKIAELLAYDLPLSDNEYEIKNLFTSFEEDLENSKTLFPEIFQYYSIKEYNAPIINFCNVLFDANVVPAKKLNSFRKIIETNAKLEYKRIASWKEKNPIEEEDKATAADIVKKAMAAVTNASNEDEMQEVVDYSESVETSEAPVSDLLNYMSLLSNFPENTDSKALLTKIKKLDIPQLNVELLRLGMIHNTYTDDEIQEALDNTKTKYITIQLLLNKDRKSFFEGIEDDEIAKSAVINFENLKEKDAISLLEKHVVATNGKEVTYFFFEIVRKVDKDEVAKKELYPIAFINNDKKINALAYKVFSSENISEGDDVKKKCTEIITEYLNEKHSRASFKKQKDENINFPLEDY